MGTHSVHTNRGQDPSIWPSLHEGGRPGGATTVGIGRQAGMATMATRTGQRQQTGKDQWEWPDEEGKGINAERAQVELWQTEA